MNVNAYPDEWNHARRVSFGDVRRGLEHATLPERKSILDFIRSNVNRIRPNVDDDWLYDVMSNYFLDCIALPANSNFDDESIHSPFEAAHELVDWFNWLVARDSNATVIQKRIDRIATVFKHGNERVQNCIETGFLEHVLETQANRAYFAYWKDDDVLSDSYTEALRWGEAHTKPNAP